MADIETIAREAKAIAEKATPGPWAWREEEENDRIAPKSKKYPFHRRALPGQKLRNTYIYCLVGALRNPQVPPPERDRFDFHQIAALRWSSVRGTVLVNSRPEGCDAALIAHAGTHYGALADEVLRLRAELALTKRKLADALAGVGAPARALTDIQIHLENTGPCDSPSCLLWGHLATLLRQSGYAQGPIFDRHFEGTSMERRT